MPHPHWLYHLRLLWHCTRYWVYPSHMPVREYQFTMVRASLFNNTLVCLPTGLGKTLVAAVVMFNYLRWFPEGETSTSGWLVGWLVGWAVNQAVEGPVCVRG